MKEEQLCIKTEERPRKTCAFTGHRELYGDFSAEALKEKIETLIKEGVEIFYNGGAKGFDLIAAETTLLLKKTYPNIRLVVCAPFYGQEKYFSKTDKKRYATIVKEAEETVLISPISHKGAFLERDRYMADRADVLIAYLKKQTGGTAYTVEYFRKKYPEKEIVFV